MRLALACLGMSTMAGTPEQSLPCGPGNQGVSPVGRGVVARRWSRVEVGPWLHCVDRTPASTPQPTNGSVLESFQGLSHNGAWNGGWAEAVAGYGCRTTHESPVGGVGIEELVVRMSMWCPYGAAGGSGVPVLAPYA